MWQLHFPFKTRTSSGPIWVPLRYGFVKESIERVSVLELFEYFASYEYTLIVRLVQLDKINSKSVGKLLHF